MWSALRSDLKEFVSTVTEDTSQVLSKIDDSFPVLAPRDARDGNEISVVLTPEEEEALRRMQLEETYTAPLLVEADDDSADYEKAALQEFVGSFRVTPELEQDLETYPELRDMYQKLVLGGGATADSESVGDGTDAADTNLGSGSGVVSRRDFWMRYVYRCDADRIAAEWNAQEEAAETPAATVSASLSRFLGGAVQSVAASLREGDSSALLDVDGALVSTGAASTAGSSATGANGGGGFFGVGGTGMRPPFVMNTAVDEDEDEEDEEELGWDDDDEEDEEEEGEDEADGVQDQTDEIEFRDAATEQLQEQLRQALEERDQLHETVAMQSKQIAALTAAQEGGGGGGASGDVEALQLQLFETQSELAAVKSRLEGPTFEENPPSNTTDKAAGEDCEKLLDLERQVEHLQAQLAQSKATVANLQAHADQLQVNRNSLAAEKQDLMARLESLQASAASKDQEIEALMLRERDSAQRFEADLQERQSKLDLAERRIAELEQDLIAAASHRPDASGGGEEEVSVASPGTHHSSVSGVKVEAPASLEHGLQTTTATPVPTLPRADPPPVVEREEGSQDGSDWGDDW